MSDRNRILERTNGGLNVFTHYLGDGCKNRLFRNPYRTDSNPSCRLKFKEGRDGIGKWIMTDYGDSQWHGDCFWLVARISQLDLATDFMEVLRIIDKDLNLFCLDDRTTQSHQMMSKVQQSDDFKPGCGMLTAKPVYQVMPQNEKDYWMKYGIAEDVLQRYDVKSVYFCKLTRPDGTSFNIRSTWNYPVFAYRFNNDQGIKFYRPGSSFRFIYAGKLPNPYIFGWSQLPQSGDVVYITGGEKDVMSLAAKGFTAVCFNSETCRLRSTVLGELASRFSHIVLLYDSDETGKRESALRISELAENFPISRVILPLSGTKQEKDISDFFSLGHTSTELKQLTTDAISNLPIKI